MEKKDRDRLKEFLRQSLLEYHIDRAEVLYDTMVEIQGWGCGPERIRADRISPRGRKPSSVQNGQEAAGRTWWNGGIWTTGIKSRRSASGSPQTVEETGGKKAVLKFLGSFGEQTYEIDIQELRQREKEKRSFGTLPQRRKRRTDRIMRSGENGACRDFPHCGKRKERYFPLCRW